MTKTMLSASSTRLVFAALATACVALLAAAYYLQYGPGQQQPCPLCIMQRYVYMAIAIAALLAAAVGPQRRGAKIYALVLGIFSATGMGLAIWQVSKGDTMASCLTDPVGEFVYALPMRLWWPEFLAAYGGCADRHPPILGVSVPVWSLLWFAGFFAVCTFVLLQLARRARN